MASVIDPKTPKLLSLSSRFLSLTGMSEGCFQCPSASVSSFDRLHILRLGMWERDGPILHDLSCMSYTLMATGVYGHSNLGRYWCVGKEGYI